VSGFTLRSRGYRLAGIRHTADISTLWTFGRNGGGLGEVKWQMDLPPDFDHPALQAGALVDVMDSGMVVGQAILGEPGRTEQGLEFVANGIYRGAERFLCFNAALESTTRADAAIDTAIGYGLPWKRPNSISNSALKTTDISDSLNTLDQLLSSLAEELGQYWRIDRNGVVVMEAAPTVPTWNLVPGFAYPGVDDIDYASHLFGRYVSGAALATREVQDAPASARWGYRQFGVDMTALGSISDARVDNRLNGLLKRGRARLRFTERLEVSPTDLLTAGGRPASLSMVRGGQVVRVHGLNSYSQWLNGNPYLDFVIGEASWANGASSMTIAPLDFSGKSLTDRLTVNAPSNLKP